MKIKNYAVSKNIAIFLLIMITISASTIVYSWTMFSIETVKTNSMTQESASLIKIEHVSKLPSGGVSLYIRNIGNRRTVINTVYVKDARKGLIREYRVKAEIMPHEVSEIIIPALELSRLNMSKIELMLGSAEGVVVKLRPFLNTAKEVANRKEPTYICLQAFRYSDSKTHWVIFDYITGKYWLYDRTYGILKGPYVGYAPILKDTNEYTIATSWTSWPHRPINSPVLIVVNPVKAGKDWIFTWHDPHGTFRFHLQKLRGNVEIDFLVFWEDLFNPYNPPGSVDDWKDHVVRVTVFTNGTFRIAVYMAKGGYKQSFYLNVPRNMFTNIDELSPIYTKPYGSYWNVRADVYEMSDKVFYVKI